MLIDKYVPSFQFRERHTLEISAQASDVLRAAINYQPDNDPIIQAAIAIREFPNKFINRIKGNSLPTKRPFSLKNFTLLDYLEDSEAVFGLTGRFWQADYGQVSLQNSEDFLNFNAHGAARLALNFSVECLANSRTRLATETRVCCLDAEAKRKFTPYWYLIRPISGLIRQKMLATIRRTATVS
ncbi:MAG: hypothetical protein GX413_13305 [Acetobacter sp.]|nr:hypothetical protein [Acetobacter sp.]